MFAKLGVQTNLPQLGWLVPLGISFFTLQIIAYLVDVYRGKQIAETHLGHYALTVSFFPQLSAGPITRFSSLLPQISTPLKFLPENMIQGFHRILWGAVQKFIIADQLAKIIDPIWQNSDEYGSAMLAVTVYLFFDILK